MSLTLSKRYHVHFGRQCLWMQKGSSAFALCGTLAHQFFFSLASSLWLREFEPSEIANFFLRHGRAEPERAEFRRVWSRTWKFSLRDEVVHIVALQQFIFDAGSLILERKIHSLKI